MPKNNVTLLRGIEYSNARISNLVHPDYRNVSTSWQKLRDVLAGAETIKAEGETYLPSFSQDAIQTKGYADYLARAVFTPFTQKVHKGMLGTLFKRKPILKSNLSERLVNFDGISLVHADFSEFMHNVCSETLAMGRAGVLVDYNDTVKRARALLFRTENILSWEETTDGKLVYLLLRQNMLKIPRITDANAPIEPTNPASNYTKSTYLAYEISPTDGLCYATLFDDSLNPVSKTLIRARGKALTHIPFTFFGSEDNTARIQSSSLIDVADMNIAHYQNYALLQLGRKHTAFPIYVVQVPENAAETASYALNPSVVWEVPESSKPMVLEFFGQGLNHLRESLTQLESQMVQISARLVGLRDLTSKYEDREIFKILFSAEQSTLLDMAKVVTRGMEKVLEDYVLFNSIPGKPDDWGIQVKFNHDLRVSNIEARELRAVALMHADGLLPLSESYRILKANNFIDEDTSFNDYKNLVMAEREERRQEKFEELILRKTGNNPEDVGDNLQSTPDNKTDNKTDNKPDNKPDNGIDNNVDDAQNSKRKQPVKAVKTAAKTAKKRTAKRTKTAKTRKTQ